MIYMDLRDIKSTGGARTQVHDLTVRVSHELISARLEYREKRAVIQASQFGMLTHNYLLRLEATQYHVELLLRAQEEHQIEHASPPERWARAFCQFALFDSILLHARSSFDYLANALGYIPDPPMQFKRSPWNNLKQMSDPEKGADYFREMGTAASVRQAHADWIKGLSDHRNLVAHQAPQSGGYQSRRWRRRGEHELIVYAPSGFVERFPSLRKAAGGEEVTVWKAAVWIYGKTVDTALTLLQASRQDLKANQA